MDDKNIKTNNAILALLLEQQEIEQVKKEVGLVPNGDEYETHAGKFFTSANLITLRDKVDFGLGSTNFAGLVAKNYDGANEGQLVFGADGYARVGDKGNLQMIATREDAPLSNGIAFYDNATKKFKTKAESTLSVAQAANANKLGTYAASQYLRNDIDNPKLSVSGGLTFTLEADSDNSNESDNVTLILSQDGGGNTASLGLNSSNDLYLNHGSKQVFKYDEGEEDIIFDSTVHSSAKFNKTVLYSPTSSNDIMNIRRYGSDHTVLNVWSPPQTSWGGAKESTLSLVRGDGNEYFMDFYNMDYGSSDQGNNLDYGEPEMGIRLQKRGSGAYTPFYIEYGNGSDEFKALEIHPNGTDSSNHSSVTLNRLIANYDGNRKFETTSNGVKSVGDHTVLGTMYLQNSSPDLVFHDTNEISQYKYWRLTNSGGADKFILAQSSDDLNYIERFSINELGTKTTGTHTITNSNGVGEIGSKNNSWFHFETDRPNFYFNKGIHATDRFAIYGTNTYLSNGILKLNSNDWIKHTDAANEGWEIVTDGTKDLEILRNIGIINHRDTAFKGTIGTAPFVSGIGGKGTWRISQNANAEFDNLDLREGLTCNTFTNNKINISNGDLIVSDTDTIEYVDGNILYFSKEQPFRVGDILRCQGSSSPGNIKSYYITVESEGTSQSRTDEEGVLMKFITFTGKTGSGTIEIGDILLRWNSSDTDRKGLLYMSSSSTYSPFYDVIYDGQTKARYGRLDGITTSTGKVLSGYGLWAQNGYFEGWLNAKEGLIANCTINADSVSTSGWTLNSDGSGNLAKGAIAWDINGNTTLGSGVTLQWEHLNAESKANLKGEKGDQGIQGVQGVAGQDGATGPKGVKGDQGVQGIQGATGPKGDTGSKGDKGDPGANGINGQDGRDGKDSPILFFNTETRNFPTNTNYAGGTKYTFTSAWAGPATIWVKAYDAEGAIHCGLNSSDLGTMSGPDNATLWYKFDCTLVAGSNEISIWSTTADGGYVYELIVKAEPIKNTYIDATGLYTGTINANKINAGTISADRIGAASIGASKIKTNELVVGHNIAMGSNATISWNKVTGTSGVETTTGAQSKADAAKNSAISVAASDATTKANNAQTAATNVANSAITKANNAQSTADSAKNLSESLRTNQGMAYSKSITVGGDARYFYPVIIKYGDQTKVRRIVARRSFSATAPHSNKYWNNSTTHFGGLTVNLRAVFGGWGGAQYSWHVDDLNQIYNTNYGGCFGGAEHCGHYMMFAIFLRGGGATYDLLSDQSLNDVHIAYSSSEKIYDHSNNSYDRYAPAPKDSESSSVRNTIIALITAHRNVDGNLATTITNNTLSTTNVIATNLRVKAANVQDKLKANQIETSQLIVGDNITMGSNATISWSKVTDTSGVTSNISNAQNTANTALTNANNAQATANSKITSAQATQITKDTVTAPYINGLTCTFNKGSIGGWNINSSAIYSGTYQGSNTYTSTGITIHKDGAIRAKNFRIDTNGNAYFRGDITGASGNFSGSLLSESGTIGGFKIGSSYLKTSNWDTSGASSRMRINSSTGKIEVRGASNRVSYVSHEGVFANDAGQECWPASSGSSMLASIAGLGFANVAKDEFLGTHSQFTCGVYGAGNNSGSAPSYGGYFTSGGVYASRIVIGSYTNTGSTSSGSPTKLDASKYSSFIIGSTNSRRYYKLTGGEEGQIVYLFNRNDSASAYIQTGVLADNWEYEVQGGVGLTMMYVTDTFYGGTISGDRWVIVGRYDQNW
jgi:hypothetical protein